MIFGQQIVRLRAATRRSRGGDLVEDWTPEVVDRLPIDDVSVQANTQSDSTDAEGTLATIGYRVLTAPGVVPDIRDTDRIEYRGEVHSIVGDIGYWPDPDGLDHVEFRIVLYKGG